jgi:DNA-binding transcriptional MerR regulator
MSIAGVRTDDPLSKLRAYRSLAPWNLRDLATVAGAILETSGVRPINAAASTRPNERTIRFYVTKGLVTPPDGRGTAATYSYRHLLQVLGIKLRQMEGATLAAIAQELATTSGDVLERRVAAALGESLPAPHELPDTDRDRPVWGRAGRALRGWGPGPVARAPVSSGSTWQRIPVLRGVELHVASSHPLAHLPEHQARIAEAVRRIVSDAADATDAEASA